jgi:hypothetical protein
VEPATYARVYESLDGRRPMQASRGFLALGKQEACCAECGAARAALTWARAASGRRSRTLDDEHRAAEGAYAIVRAAAARSRHDAISRRPESACSVAPVTWWRSLCVAPVRPDDARVAAKRVDGERRGARKPR